MMETRKVVIKKYENRRLYDTTGSRYVNLDEVAQMVREGVDVQVIDAATGEDITRLVLTQIIVDNAKGPNSTFPLDMLRHMVIASGKASQEGMLNYMRAMFDMYQSSYRALTPPFDFMEKLMKGTQAGPAAEPPPQTPPEPSEVTEFRRRIEELEKLVAKASTARKPGKTTRSSGRR